MADVLVVDDEENWRELYVERLSEAGHDVRAAGDGNEALEEMRTRIPDIVVLDIRMAPSGRHLLRSIMLFWPEVPVVVSSAYGGYRGDADFMKATAFVDKTLDLGELVEAIAGILGARRGPGSQGESREAV
ncbi:MAG: response regulator [Planctomycetota bacterium]|jgi:DNA-binding NtrC family response regulator